MNLPTSNHLNLSNASFLTVASLLIFNIFAMWKTDTKTTFCIAEKTVTTSEAISWNEAVQMKNMFVGLSPISIEVPDGRGNNTEVPLEGFKIQASQLLELINNNKNGGQADEVMFYFGAKQSSSSNIPSFNIIAVGIKNNALMIPSTAEGKANPGSSSIFDKADPCPPMCPNQN